jgi:hypothetical protein
METFLGVKMAFRISDTALGKEEFDPATIASYGEFPFGGVDSLSLEDFIDPLAGNLESGCQFDNRNKGKITKGYGGFFYIT